MDGGVDTRIRFADVPKYRPPTPAAPPLVRVQFAQDKDNLLAGLVFGALTLSTIAGGVLADPGMPDPIPAGQIAVAFATGTYIQKARLSPADRYEISTSGPVQHHDNKVK